MDSNHQRILILTGRFGQGHFAVAEAIKASILKNYPKTTVIVADVVEELMPWAKNIVYAGFDAVASHWTGLYNFLGRNSAKSSTAPLKAVLIRKTERMLKAYRPDMVISTLPMCTQYMNVYKRFKHNTIPLYTCITDISSGEEWLAPKCDGYFVASAEVKEDLLKFGIPAAKIHITGIPVRQEFLEAEPRKNRKKHLLIMGGGLGLIPLDEAVYAFLNRNEEIEVTVITGQNKELEKRLTDKYQNITVLGFSDKVHEYMKKADMILSKSGGSTMFEAIHTETPLLILPPFLEQENHNAAFIKRHHFGYVFQGKTVQVQELRQILNDEAGLKEMQKNMQRFKTEIETEISCFIMEQEQTMEGTAS